MPLTPSFAVKPDNISQFSYGQYLLLPFVDNTETGTGFAPSPYVDGTWRVLVVRPDGSLLDKVIDGADGFLADFDPQIAFPVAGLDLDQKGRYYYQVIRTDSSTGPIEYRMPVESFVVNGSLPAGIPAGGGTAADAGYLLTYNGSGAPIPSILRLVGGVLTGLTPGAIPTGVDAAKIADGSVSNTEFQTLNGVTGGIQGQLDSKQPDLGFTPEDIANKNASDGYPGLSGYKLSFWNNGGTQLSFIQNTNTAPRTYTLPDRTGTLADNTDLAAKQDVSGKNASGGYPGLSLFKLQLPNNANTFTSLLQNTNTAVRTYSLPDRTGTLADDTDMATKLTKTSNLSDLNNIATARLNLGLVTPYIAVKQALGSTIKAEVRPLEIMNQTQTLTAGQLYLQAIWLPVAGNVTGIKWWQAVQGVYTGSNYSKVGLFTYSGGTLTLVASSADDTALWKVGTQAFGTKAFSTPYLASGGLYFIGILYNRSAETTAPQIVATNSMYVAGGGAFEYTNSAKEFGYVSGLTDLPATQAMTGVNSIGIPIWLALY